MKIAVAHIIVQTDVAMSDTELETLTDRVEEAMELATDAVVTSLREKFPNLEIHAE